MRAGIAEHALRSHRYASCSCKDWHMAAEDQSTELLPRLDSDEPFFDVTMRGYDKRQVEDYVARAAAEIAELTAARDAALATSADRPAQLASREAQMESLKAQVARRTETLDPAA